MDVTVQYASLLLIAVTFVVMCFLVMGFVFKQWGMFLLAALVSAVYGIVSLSTNTVGTLFWALSYPFLGLTFVCAVLSFTTARNLNKQEDEEYEARIKALPKKESYSDMLDREIAETTRMRMMARRNRALSILPRRTK